jgi:hypothetical protein
VSDLKPGPWSQSTGHGGLSRTVAEHPRGPWPGGPVQRGKRPVALCRAARAGRARGVVTAQSPRTRRHGGVLADGTVVASWWQGAAGKHQWDLGVAPGKEEGVGAHQKGRLMARRRKRC